MRKQPKITWAFVLILIIALFIVGFTTLNKEDEKLVALGDSLTYGLGDESGHGYVENLNQWLSKHKEHDIEVDNHGIPDQQSDGLLAQLQKDDVLESVGEAHHVLLFIGMNDIIKSNGGDLSELHPEKLEKGKMDYESNLKEILGTIRKTNPDAPIVFVGLYNPVPGSEEISTLYKNWNETSKSIIDDSVGITYVPTDDLFNDKKYFSDNLHLNEQGYERLTMRIIDEYDFSIQKKD
ncbi:DUF459 domain-containing protein [Thalassobacillus hwangdonensis]|uniref:GDSL-type esterase/lipase family protein n=1 Tax=Thalassobacillus hwangdonensis TaxID=546108 RepID=A0ABW3L6B1_9BACI